MLQLFRAWPQSATAPSPMKSASKSSQPSKRLSPLHRIAEKQNHRRVELFPVSGSPQALKSCDQEIKSSIFPLKDSEASLENFHGRGNQSPNTQWPSSMEYKLKDEEVKISTSEVNSLTTSSPLSSSITSDVSPQLTPINKRVYSCKSNERRSPAVMHSSPDHNFKTPTRSNGMCLGDFITKGAKGFRGQQGNKRLSLSPSNNPEAGQSNSCSEQQNNYSNKKKQRRRINPTKVSVENNPSSPQSGKYHACTEFICDE